MIRKAPFNYSSVIGSSRNDAGDRLMLLFFADAIFLIQFSKNIKNSIGRRQQRTHFYFRYTRLSSSRLHKVLWERSFNYDVL